MTSNSRFTQFPAAHARPHVLSYPSAAVFLEALPDRNRDDLSADGGHEPLI
jgi:hypothetical protein